VWAVEVEVAQDLPQVLVVPVPEDQVALKLQ
jgi:hypothetical protein